MFFIIQPIKAYYFSMKASDLISKKVYSISQGKELGYVLNISFDERVCFLENFIICSLYEENEFVLNVEEVVSINNEALFIESDECLSYESNFIVNNPISKKVFSINGDNMGKVVDVEIEKGKVMKVVCSVCEILPKHIYSCGQDCLFFSKSKKKLRKSNKQKPETVVTLQEVIMPLKQKFQGQNMLGKTIIKDIVDENHIITFRKNTLITPKILIEAKSKRLLKVLGENVM